jgi:hypothetical protein
MPQLLDRRGGRQDLVPMRPAAAEANERRGWSPGEDRSPRLQAFGEVTQSRRR